MVLDFSGSIGSSQTKRATGEVARSLRKMGHGYTLVEAFRGVVKFSKKAAGEAGRLVGTCYERGRIWRVVTVTLDGGVDPGLRILHRTRWGRGVPETEVDRAGGALALAAREVSENSGWIDGGGAVGGEGALGD